MPQSLHISIFNLKKSKRKPQHPPSHVAYPPGHNLFGCMQPKNTLPAVDQNRSRHPEINSQIESPRAFLFDSPRLMLMMDPPSDLRGSQRFFVTTGASSSLAEEARLSASASTAHDGIAVPVYSSKPYDEFYGSMVEMVASRLEGDRAVDWDYMEELLLCYFDLNEKRFHQHIMRAFVDVTMGLRQISGEKPATSLNILVAHCRRRKRRG